jgi:hypothetical protein
MREVRDHLAEEKGLRGSSSPWGGGQKWQRWRLECGEEWRWLGHQCRWEAEGKERWCAHVADEEDNGGGEGKGHER